MMNNKNILQICALSLAGVAMVACGGEPTPAGTSSSLSGVVGTKTRYTLVLNPCDGKGVSSYQYLLGAPGDDNGNLPDGPSRNGYVFSGWSRVYDKETKQGDPAHQCRVWNFNDNGVLYGYYTKAVVGGHTPEEVKAYMDSLEANSKPNTLYLHYYRFGNSAADYEPWDIWAWPYRPLEGEGARFDWNGRVQSADHMSASGDAEVDDFGGATVEIDLTKTYDGGTTNKGHSIGGTPVSFYANEEKTAFDTRIGIQVVKSADRLSDSGDFWGNDGGNVYLDLEDASMTTTFELEGGKAHHIFLLQEKVGSPQALPFTEMSDPYEYDDGTNTTDKAIYQTADWNDKPVSKTSKTWKDGVGVGYQIMVASFADSDGDGFGDIYGIEQKLDYLEGLGVKALWLTPIQLSDSYHGYDISDYLQVDPKFGSKESPAAKAAGKVTMATAMEDYKSLLEKAHARGMKVVMDLVLNHTSTSNKWFVSSSQLDEEHRGYYQWGNHKTNSSINQKNCWYPYGEHDYSYYAKFGSGMPELNFSYQNTREAVEDIALTWCSLGVDGFRVDAVKHIYMADEIPSSLTSGDTIISDVAAAGDYSSDLTKNLNFFRELSATIKKEYPNAFFVGENFDGHAFHVAPYYEGFDSMFDFYAYFKMTNLAASAYDTNARNKKWNSAGSFMTPGEKWNSSADGVKNGSKEYAVIDGKYGWNLPELYKAYDTYRGDTALPGTFTSNHDIARNINRIAGSFDSATCEIAEQGKVTSSNYTELNKKSLITKAAQILFPGCTWIYYGDELGMTGNFEAGKNSHSDYADLAYRQPMKWVDKGVKGDGSFTTSYSINGAAATIAWDEVNASSLVASAEKQAADANSVYSKLAKVVAFKNAHPSLISGTFSDAGSNDYVLKWKSAGAETFTISADLVNNALTVTGSASLSIKA